VAIGVLFLFSAPLRACADASAAAITSRDKVVDGVKLHYLTAGNGPTVILIHGYAETSRMRKPLIPLLAQKFNVIAPDQKGRLTR
jgi:alpha-beta hydrolase superfamily lysophospholipase